MQKKNPMDILSYGELQQKLGKVSSKSYNLKFNFVINKGGYYN